MFRKYCKDGVKDGDIAKMGLGMTENIILRNLQIILMIKISEIVELKCWAKDKQWAVGNPLLLWFSVYIERKNTRRRLKKNGEPNN